MTEVRIWPEYPDLQMDGLSRCLLEARGRYLTEVAAQRIYSTCDHCQTQAVVVDADSGIPEGWLTGSDDEADTGLLDADTPEGVSFGWLVFCSAKCAEETALSYYFDALDAVNGD